MFKKTALLFLVAFWTMAFVSAQDAPISVKKGAKYTYDVNFGGTKYQFIMEITGADKSVEYKWNMTLGPQYKGHVSLRIPAMNKAMALDNFYNPGNKKLEDFTAGFISREAYELFTKGKTIQFNAGSGKKKFTAQPTTEVTTFKMGDKVLDALYVVSEDGKEKLWITKNDQHPLILKMEIGWTISLSKIE
ncbi:MAG TPA: hypothetical protein DIW24_07975 [Bacteroidetes bacterium]|nr:hypothetical protein [Bacteroidota bacterium]HRR07638.1 hypothetical protein [Rhodothermales bacterium]